MPPSSPQFTPAQVLQAGRRAESEGKPDLAEHFFRHLVEHYGATPEAAAARDGLTRLGEKRGGQPLAAATASAFQTRAAPPAPPNGRAPPAVIGSRSEAGRTEAVARGEAESGDEAPVDPRPPEIVPPESLVLPAGGARRGRRYRVGRLMARLAGLLGWLMVLAGLALVPLAMSPKAAEWMPLLASPAGIAATAGWAAMQSFGGVILVLVAQVARAIFDMAEEGGGGGPKG